MTSNSQPESREPALNGGSLPEPASPHHAAGAGLLRAIRHRQDQIAALLGTSVGARSSLVAAMLERSPHEATSYWLQLTVSIGIATLGLVVGSTAVIIGAMLVAPLMGPIIALAMGLAIGSPVLVLRTALRIVLSVAVAIGGAAVITLLLPFHELTAEIAARTAPTVLDLVTAGFCALAGVYASLRPGSDTATTAAGTSIGISLVPPLCASGFGIGTANWEVASGAVLLFLTNLVAIIFIGSISFVVAGFNQVPAMALEQAEFEKTQRTGLTAALSRRFAGLFSSRAGPVLRFLMPLLLLAAVYVPLRRALDEVAWQVSTRAAVQDLLRREGNKIVQTRVRVERNEVDLLVVLLGKNDEAEATRARLSAEIERAARVTPRVEVLAIPDATAFAGLESALHTKGAALQVRPVAPPPPPSPADQLARGKELIRTNLRTYWPEATAGAPLAIELGVEDRGPLRVQVTHLGAALGADALESLSRGLATGLEQEVVLRDSAIPDTPLTRAEGDLALVGRLAAALRASLAVPSLHVCASEPAPVKNPRRRDPREQELDAAIKRLLADHPRVSLATGEAWSIHFRLGPCAPDEPPAAVSPPT